MEQSRSYIPIRSRTERDPSRQRHSSTRSSLLGPYTVKHEFKSCQSKTLDDTAGPPSPWQLDAFSSSGPKSSPGALNPPVRHGANQACATSAHHTEELTQGATVLRLVTITLQRLWRSSTLHLVPWSRRDVAPSKLNDDEAAA